MLLSQHQTIFIQLFVHVAGGASLSNEIFSGFGCDICWQYYNLTHKDPPGANTSHLGTRNIIFKTDLVGDMLVPRRVDHK